jgi:hypothetical protein
MRPVHRKAKLIHEYKNSETASSMTMNSANEKHADLGVRERERERD